MDFAALFSGFPPEIATFILAMLPITELRASIPIAILAYKMHPLAAIFWSVLGDILPAYLILLLLGPFSDILRKYSKLADRFFSWWFNRVQEKFFSKYTKYGAVALMIFVAIPLPVTGSWTGATAAWLFNIPKKTAAIYITLGVVIAGLIVTTLTAGVKWLLIF